MATVEHTTPEEPDELARVYDYKVGRLREFGYENLAAHDLAAAGIDVHYVQDLIEHGCDLPTAARIAR